MITLSSVFEQGNTIPTEYTCDGSNISPPFTWFGIPENTYTIALIMEDPDVPEGTFVHWIIFNIPSYLQGLPKGIPKVPIFGDSSRQGLADFGTVGYGGPCPPPGPPHRYFFRIYALDSRLNIPPGMSKHIIERAMTYHILATGELMGLYCR